MGSASRNELEIMEIMSRKIPGNYGRREGRFLYRLARRKGNLVEIGCWQGRTTAIMKMAANVWGGHLTSIDVFGKEHMPPPYNKLEHSPEVWRNNLVKIGLEPPELLVMTSDEASEVYNRPIHLLLLDGDHREAQVSRDLRNWTPKMVKGSYLILHDMFFPSIRGVARAVGRWWDGRTWKLVEQVEYTLAFRKIRE